MKKLFPVIVKEFECNYTNEETVNKILERLKEQGFDFHVARACDDELTSEIVLNTKTEHVLIRNSFLPDVTIKTKEAERTSVSVSFELKKSVRLFLTAFLVLSLVLEIVLCVFLMCSGSYVIWQMLIPIGLSIFAYILSVIGLLISSKKYLNMNTGDGSMIDKTE